MYRLEVSPGVAIVSRISGAMSKLLATAAFMSP
jgi:hypothetical protein